MLVSLFFSSKLNLLFFVFIVLSDIQCRLIRNQFQLDKANLGRPNWSSWHLCLAWRISKVRDDKEHPSRSRQLKQIYKNSKMVGVFEIW